MRRTITVRGDVSLAEAWERYADLRRWPDWAPQIVAVDPSAWQLAPGVTGTVHGPLGAQVAFRVDAVDAGRHTWRWTVTVPGVRVTMIHDLTATDHGTVAGLTVDGPAVVALAYPPLARIALGRLVAP